MANWNIGDTDANDANKLQWHKIKDGAKTLLICDRVILVNVSWDDLHSDNRVYGKTITIDGQQYKLRLLTAGAERREGGTGSSYGGGKLPNEWDRFITNEDAIAGIPIPTASDLDTTLNATDKNSAHNQFWNWMGVYSWGQETYLHSSAYRAVRGYYSARYWNNGDATARLNFIGWRPALEILNSAPSVNLASPSNNQILSEGTALSIQGSASEVDNGNVITVKYKINNGTERALHSTVSDGSSPISFAKNLTFQGDRLYDGTTDVSGPLAEGTTHTLSVWAIDDQGGTSAIVTRSFTVQYNKGPTITVDPYTATQTGLIEPDTVTLSGSASDPDGNTFTVKGKLNSGAEQTLLNGVSSGNWTFSFPVSSLQAGSNTVTITATDQFGKATIKTFSVNKTEQKTPLTKGVARYDVIPPLGTAKTILAWLKRQKGDLIVDVAASFVDAGQPEQYIAATKSSVDLTTEIAEDEFVVSVATAKPDIVFKQTFTRADANSTQAATSLVGVIE